MLNKNFYKKALLTALTMASAISYAPMGNAALASYSENFESLNATARLHSVMLALLFMKIHTMTRALQHL